MGSFAGALVDLLFPPKCLTCGALAEPFCGGCRAEIRRVGEQPGTGAVSAVTSAGYHEGPLREAVLRLKFGRRMALVEPLAELLAAELSGLPHWQIDAVAPVPIHWLRRLDRGFNQSELLAGSLCRRAAIDLVPALRRVRAAPPQVGLSRSRRAVNLRGAFAVDLRYRVTGRRVLLLDDVTTTGATLAECAAVLRSAGAAEVFGLTLTLDAYGA